MIDTRPACLACGKPIDRQLEIVINGDYFHKDCTPEGDPDYSKLIETTMTFKRSTKGTHVYINEEEHTPIPTLYIKRDSLADAPPVEIEVKIWPK